MSDLVIILPTYSDYIGITKNFMQLLHKNWPDCPYRIVVSVAGQQVKIDGAENLYNGKNVSLIDCVANVAKKYKSRYYISFLGDAFISKPIDNRSIILMLNDLMTNSVEYCSLKYVRNYKKKKKFNNWFRYINSMDRYSHNFTAFVASNNFIKNELSKYKTDLDFEKEYLFRTGNFYYDNHLVVRRNYLHLLPSIIKGKWDRINYKKLCRNNPEIEFEKRPIQNRKESLICHIRGMVVPYLPSLFRKKIKSSVEKVFNMDFGVEE